MHEQEDQCHVKLMHAGSCKCINVFMCLCINVRTRTYIILLLTSLALVEKTSNGQFSSRHFVCQCLRHNIFQWRWQVAKILMHLTWKLVNIITLRIISLLYKLIRKLNGTSALNGYFLWKLRYVSLSRPILNICPSLRLSVTLVGKWFQLPN